jgi:hypothetical protein
LFFMLLYDAGLGIMGEKLVMSESAARGRPGSPPRPF